MDRFDSSTICNDFNFKKMSKFFLVIFVPVYVEANLLTTRIDGGTKLIHIYKIQGRIDYFKN